MADAKPDAKPDATPDAKPSAKPDAKPAPARAAGGAKKRKKIVEAEGIAHITATFNNTLITICDMQGNAIRWGSSGKAGFKGSKKSTPFAATVAAEQAAREALNLGVKRVHVRVQGPGSGRESAIQALASAGLQIRSIRDVTPIPHNGGPPPKKRRGFKLRYTGAAFPLWRRAGPTPVLQRK